MLKINMFNNKNSILQRLVSGSIASWTRIFLLIFVQILLVPIYLSNWDVTIYGAWLLIMSFLNILMTFSLGVHDYVGFNCLKINKKNKKLISSKIISSIPILILFSLTSILLTILLNYNQQTIDILNINDSKLKSDWFNNLILLTVCYFFTSNISGIIERWFYPYNYYTSFIWLNVLKLFILSVFPAFGVYFGLNFNETVNVYIFSDFFYHIIFYYYIYIILKKEKLKVHKPKLKFTIDILKKSLFLSLRYIIDTVRQFGSRLVLAPLSNPEIVATFTTIRTGANFAQQGLMTIMTPIIPDLIKIIKERDQEKFIALTSFTWIAICIIISPLLIILQIYMPQFFNIWTLGKMEYNSELFAIFSIIILCFAINQPLDAIIRSNNLIKEQILISVTGALVVIIGMIFLVPHYSIVGAGISLLIAEITIMIILIFTSTKWLNKNRLKFPWKPYIIVLIVSLNTVVSFYLIIYNIDFYLITILQFLIHISMIFIFWIISPQIVKEKIYNVLKKYKDKVSF